MNKIKELLAAFARKINILMAGRNGFDELGSALLWAVVIVSILYNLTGSKILYAIYCVGFVYWVFRTFSKNLAKRREENEKYKRFANSIRARLTQSKDYKFYTCPKCGANVRVPRHRGKLEVTCPKCGEKKIVDTGAKK